MSFGVSTLILVGTVAGVPAASAALGGSPAATSVVFALGAIFGYTWALRPRKEEK